MNMYLKKLSAKWNKNLNEFLWNEWSSVGVPGYIRENSNNIVDPEALFVFSLSQARFDVRLFDEIFDWVVKNERWLSFQRIKTYVRQYESDEINRILQAFSRNVYSATGNIRWKVFLKRADFNDNSPSPFFLNFDTSTLPIPGNYDENFESAGWLRSPMHIRNKSSDIPFDSEKNLLFKLRTLFGITPRAEIMAYLICNEKVSVAEIINSTGYSKPSVYDTLSDLATGRYIDQYNKNGSMKFSINLNRWKHFLNLDKALPVWIDWQRLFVSLYKFSIFLIEYTNSNISDYLLKSNLITMYEILSNAFTASEIKNPFNQSIDLENALDIFPDAPIQLKP
jgi:hypothetical protein